MNAWDENSIDDFTQSENNSNFKIGVGLAVLSSGFIGKKINLTLFYLKISFSCTKIKCVSTNAETLNFKNCTPQNIFLNILRY